MSWGSLRKLREAGIVQDSTPVAVQEVLGSLARHEVELLIRLNLQTFEAAAAEVTSHAADPDAHVLPTQVAVNRP